MNERRWLIVCACAGCLAALALFWFTGPAVVDWITPTPKITKDTKEKKMGLFSNTTPTAKFQQVGDICSGTIIDISQTQRTEFLRDGSIGEPMFWSGGRPVAGAATDPRTGNPNQPVMDWVITVDTGTPDEDGIAEKRIFIKGKADLNAVKVACIAAGVRDIEIGGRIAKKWVSGGRPGGADVDNPRVYQYRYAAPGAAWNQAAREPSPEHRAAVREAVDRTLRAHESSPLMKKHAPEPAAFDEKIPF
jgi:hypothetical protein